MNNVSPINKAQRLTEAEVHAAAEELQDAGRKVTSIELYKHLGRGSLTTITNFLKSWRPGDEDKSTLPALISLPDQLKAASELLIVKVWAESQKIAEAELQSQREALRQAEAMANERIEEAQAFSDEQAKQIDELKLVIEELKKEAGDAHDYFLSEEKKLRAELDNTKKGETIFEQRLIECEKQLNKCLVDNTQLRVRIKEMEAEKQMEVDKARKEERRLESVITEIKINETVLSQKLVKAEENLIKMEAVKNDVVERQSHMNKELVKQRDEAIKEAAKLVGELNAWKTLQPKEKKIDVNSKKAVKGDYKQVEIDQALT